MNSNIKEDETLKLLKKYYLEALLAQQMPSERDNVSYYFYLVPVALKDNQEKQAERLKSLKRSPDVNRLNGR